MPTIVPQRGQNSSRSQRPLSSDLCSNVFGAEPMNSTFSVGKNTSMPKAPLVRRWQKVQWLPLSVARRSAISCKQIVGRWWLIGSYSILITEHIATNHLILLARPKRFELLTPRFVVLLYPQP